MPLTVGCIRRLIDDVQDALLRFGESPSEQTGFRVRRAGIALHDAAINAKEEDEKALVFAPLLPNES